MQKSVYLKQQQQQQLSHLSQVYIWKLNQNQWLIYVQVKSETPNCEQDMKQKAAYEISGRRTEY